MTGKTNTTDHGDNLKAVVLTLRVIVCALGLGLFGYAVVAFVIVRAGAPQAAGGAGILTTMALFATPLALLASRVVPALMVKSARKQMAERSQTAPGEIENAYLGTRTQPLSFVGVLQTKTIVAAALLEGPGFLAITAYLIEGSPIALGLGVGLALVILAMLPSKTRVTEWVEEQQRLANEEQLLTR